MQSRAVETIANRREGSHEEPAIADHRGVSRDHFAQRPLGLRL
jgi:hypothetical protein